MRAPDVVGLASASKPDLICRFLKATGIQEQIEHGDFLRGFADEVKLRIVRAGGMPPSPGLREAVLSALRDAYEKHRDVWQEDYEKRVDRVFSEDELRDVVAFLDKPAGQHFLEGLWRMEEYIVAKRELIEQICREAETAVPTG